MSKIYLPDIQVGGTWSACIFMVLCKQLSQSDVECSSDMADCQAVVRPLSAPLHVTDHWKNIVDNKLALSWLS